MPEVLVTLIAVTLAVASLVDSLPVSRTDVPAVTMPTRTTTTSNSISTSASTSATFLAEASNTCLLPRDEVQDIQSHQSDLLYMVVNGKVFATQHPLDLFAELFRIVSQAAHSSETVEDVWLSRVPCKLCIQILEYMFHGLVKPTLHIETWRTDKVQLSYSTIVQGMGCISTLKKEHYRIMSWDWERFGEDTGTTSCNHYNGQPDAQYSEEKDYLKRSLHNISGLDEFCQ